MKKSAVLFSYVWNGICIVAAVGSEVVADPQIFGLLPPKVAHTIAAAAGIAMLIRSKQNLFINPDWTSAKVAYLPPSQDPADQMTKKP